jgi:xylan 1,4-beta-xylosidase
MLFSPYPSRSSPQPATVAPVASTISALVHWEASIAETTPFTFGVSGHEVVGAEGRSDPTLSEHFRRLGIRLVRLRCPGLTDRWANPLTSDWDETTVRESLSRADSFQVVLNLPLWPSWMRQDGDRLLHVGEHAAYARLCARLVEMVNRRHRRRIVYWELMHELEERYRRANRLTELWQLYNTLAVAMKRADPSIRIGGPAFAAGDPQLLETFLLHCRAHIDFVSWHDYLRCPLGEPGERLLAQAIEVRERLQAVKALVKTHLGERSVPLLIGECNIDRQPRCPAGRASERIDAVWLASVFKHLAEAGTDMVAFSHLKGDHLGLYTAAGRPRPVATVLGWFARHLVGRVCRSTVTHFAVESLAVRNREGQRAVLLINKSEEPVAVRLNDLTGREPVILDLAADGSEVRGVLPRAIFERMPLPLAPLSLKLVLF